MTTEKLEKANKIQSEIHKLTCNLHDLFDIRQHKIPAVFNCGSGRKYFEVKYEDVEHIVEKQIKETEDNIRLFQRRFENL